MWRSFFLAIGLYCCILGVEALALDHAVLKPKMKNGEIVEKSRVITPPDWVPWSLMSGGTVVVLYSFLIPRRVHN